MNIVRQYVSSEGGPRIKWPLFLALLIIDVCLILSALAQGTDAALAVLKLLH